QALSRYADSLDIDPEQLHELENRLNLIQSLKRKYGATIAEVIRFGVEAAGKLSALEARDLELERINDALGHLELKIRDAGNELSTRRRKLIPQLNAAVMKELNALGFKQSAFGVAISTGREGEAPDEPFRSSGFDRIDVQFAPTPGEPSRPLRA